MWILQRGMWICEPNCSYQPEMCVHRSSRLTEHMPDLKTQSFLFTVPWRCTQAHTLPHLSVTVSPRCKQSVACSGVTPSGKLSLTLTSCAVAFPVGQIDSMLAVNQRRQVWFVVPHSSHPAPGLFGGGCQLEPTLMWISLKRNNTTCKPDSCIVVSALRRWMLGPSHSVFS